MSHVYPYVTYSNSASSLNDFLVKQRHSHKDMYFKGISECVSRLYLEPAACVVPRSPDGDRFHVHKLVGDLAGCHSFRVLPVALDKHVVCGGFRIVYKSFHKGNNYEGFYTFCDEYPEFASDVAMFLDMSGLSDFTDVPYIFFVKDLCINYHKKKLTSDIKELFELPEFNDSSVVDAISKIRADLKWGKG